jgi:hypothetical protein
LIILYACCIINACLIYVMSASLNLFCGKFPIILEHIYPYIMHVLVTVHFLSLCMFKIEKKITQSNLLSGWLGLSQLPATARLRGSGV